MPTIVTVPLSSVNVPLLAQQLAADPAIAAAGFKSLSLCVIADGSSVFQLEVTGTIAAQALLARLNAVIAAHDPTVLTADQQVAANRIADLVAIQSAGLADAANADLTARIDTVNNLTTGLLVPLQPAAFAAATAAAKTETLRATLVAILNTLALPNATQTPGVLQYLRIIIKYIKWLD